MDITPQDNSAQSISDDQELAKALAGVLPEAEEVPTNDGLSNLQFEETPSVAPISVAPIAPLPTPSDPISVAPISSSPSLGSTPSSSELDDIKLTALKELRPLMDKVELPSEEKFDTYLMLLRSTDDSTLIGPAHSAAQGISDEKRKAEALLEIIKEIDYLSRKDQPTA